MNALTLPHRIIATDAISGIANQLTQLKFGPRLLVIADEHTWRAAGEAVAQKLAGNFEVIPRVFPEEVEASLANAQMLIEHADEVDGLVAVGSGTINDLVKYAAAQRDLPYVVVATAASMNGYTSVTASLKVNGFKTSHMAKAPKAVIADLSVIAAAPVRLARAGLGDALCRSTVELDMMLSHFLRTTPYPQDLFEKLWSHEEGLFENAEGLKKQTPKAMRLLMEALLDGGDAMTEHGSSAVASQGEHMIAHTAELLLGDTMAHLTHGEVIAITSLTMSQLQHSLLGTKPKVKALLPNMAQFESVFGTEAAPALLSAYSQKLLDDDDVDAINDMLGQSWKEIVAALREVMLPPKQLQAFFEAAGVPCKAEDVGIVPADYHHVVKHAYLTRERFTFLDLAAMSEAA